MSGQISGTNWNDINNNGLQDSGEAGLADWTIYLDGNQNGQLDAGEISTTTNANGNYTFTGLNAGTYTVARIQQTSWTPTFPTNSGQSTLIPIADRRDLVFDPTRNYLYITTSDGDVERYDVNSRSLLTRFDAGNSLNGADITPDGSTLYVAENQIGATQGFIRKVNLNTGAVTNLTYDLEYDDRPSDIAIGSNGTGMVRSFGQWHQIRQLNLSTDTISERADKGSVYGGALITRGADRSLFFTTEDGISSGSIFTYNAVNNTFSPHKWTNAYLGSNLSAVNRNSSLIALEWGNGISILDRHLNSVENLNDVDSGMAFDPLRDILYAANSTTDQIIAFNTNNWNELYRLNIGEDIPSDSYGNSSQPFGNGMMSVSNDGQYLFMSTPSGVRMLNLGSSGGPAGTHAVNLSDNQVVTNINFGNTQPAPVPQLSINDITVTEGDIGTTNAVFTVNLSAPTTQTVTVNYATANNTATAYSDYYATSGSLTFAPGQTSQQIQVSLIGDANYEPDESFFVNLTNPTNATINDSQAVGTINNNDSQNSASLPIYLNDSSSYQWDIQGNGSINDGTSDAYDGGLVLNGFSYFSTAQTEDNGREVALGPTNIGNVEVSRKIYVPQNQSYARFLEIVTNTGSTATNYTVNLNTNLGSDGSTVIANTSSSDTSFTTADNWIVTDDYDGGGDPTLLHVIAGENAVRPTTVSAPTGNLSYAYDLNLQPGETKIVMHFAAQNPNQAAALSKAPHLTQLGLDALTGMSDREIQQVVNFATVPPPPLRMLSINDVTIAEGNAGTKEATFTVSLDAASSQTVTVDYATANDSAIALEDYTATTGTLSFVPGETQKTIAVLINSDGTQESDETFFVNLTNPTNGAIADDRGVGTIFNDDTVGGATGNDSLTGTAGHDTLIGGPGYDTLNGLSGNDLLDGGRDHDLLDGGDGHDTLDGGSGHDTLNGGKGKDILKGSAGDDELYGGADNDALTGEEGDDILNGNAGKDSVVGGSGDDEVSGGKGNDILIGVDADGTLPGLGELDTLTGGQGIDRFILADASKGAYYNDGLANTRGAADFALIKDFDLNEDFIQLAGMDADYVLSSVGSNTNIYLDNDGISGFSAKDELIARVSGVTNLSLTESYFLYS